MNAGTLYGAKTASLAIPAPPRKTRKARASKAHALDDNDPMLERATPYIDPTPVPLTEIFRSTSIFRMTEPTGPMDEADMEVAAITAADQDGRIARAD